MEVALTLHAKNVNMNFVGIVNSKMLSIKDFYVWLIFLSNL